MHPVLFEWPDVKIRVTSYGLMVFVSMMVSLILLSRQSRRELPATQRRYFMEMMLLCGGLIPIGGRIFYAAAQAPMFAAECRTAWASGDYIRCTHALWFWEGGFVFFGSMWSTILASWFYTSRYRLPLRHCFDITAPNAAAMAALGRLGCFLAGCCWGKPTTLPWGVSFPPASAVYQMLGLSGEGTAFLHPVQLYEAFIQLGLFFFLRRRNAHKRFHGEIVAIYLGAYSLVRIFLEQLRDDPDRQFWAGLSTSTWIGLVTFGFACFLYRRFSASLKALPRGGVESSPPSDR